MNPSTRTPEGQPNRCPVCGKPVLIDPSLPPGDAPCPHCGCLLWFPKTPGLESAYGFRRILISDPSIRTKELAIATILDRLVETGSLDAEHRQGVLAAILKRESSVRPALAAG